MSKSSGSKCHVCHDRNTTSQVLLKGGRCPKCNAKQLYWPNKTIHTGIQMLQAIGCTIMLVLLCAFLYLAILALID